MVCGSGYVPKIRNVDPVEDAAKDTADPADYHEAILVYNELAPIVFRRYQQNTLVDWAIPVPVTIRLTEEPGNTKTILETVRTELERVFGVQVSGFHCNTWEGPRNLTLAGKGFYEARYILYLHQYGVAASGGWSGTGATGGSLWAAPVVLYSASALFSAERILSLTGTDTLGADFLPSTDSTYDLGSTTKYWAEAYIDAVTTTGNVTIGGDLAVTGSMGITDADVPDTITLTDITQITNRSHTDLTDVGATTHANIDAHIADASDPHGVTLTQTNITLSGTFTATGATLTDFNLAMLSDVTLTGAYLEDLALYGEANAAYVPFLHHYNNSYPVAAGGDALLFSFVNTGAQIAWFECPLPIDAGGLSLHIKGWRIALSDADASSYVDAVVTFKGGYTGQTVIDNDGTNLTTADAHTTTFTINDCTGATRVSIRLSCQVGTTTDLDIVSVEGLVFYDT